MQIIANRADGALGNSSGARAGMGPWRRRYVATAATVTADPLTVMAANHASTSDDEVFGTIDTVP